MYYHCYLSPGMTSHITGDVSPTQVKMVQVPGLSHQLLYDLLPLVTVSNLWLLKYKANTIG